MKCERSERKKRRKTPRSAAVRGGAQKFYKSFYFENKTVSFVYSNTHTVLNALCLVELYMQQTETNYFIFTPIIAISINLDCDISKTMK